VADILHRVGIKASSAKVYEALATRDGLAGWWTIDTEGESKPGGVIESAFKHAGWKEPVEFMHHCSTKWAIYLMSLKALVETGKGAPSPDDVQISDWH
jgi:hypothetical protein